MEPDRSKLIEGIARIRAFESHLLDLFAQGKVFGTTHTCIGQEVCAVGLYANVDCRRDVVFTNHRCHGHFLAYGGSPEGLLAEIMGKPEGVCRGRGGSQHLHVEGFFSSGVQGSNAPVAAGYAEAVKRRNRGGIVILHIGDGTLGEGVVWETLNMTALRALPLLIVVEHNGYAQSTDTSHTTAGDLCGRFRAFGIETDRRRAHDPVDLSRHFAQVIPRVRHGEPFVQVLDTFRLMAHSKSDDDRPARLIEKGWDEDYFASLLRSRDAIALEAWDEARSLMRAISARIEAMPEESVKTGTALVETEPLFGSSKELTFAARGDHDPPRINELLNRALHEALKDDPAVLVIGEDLLDPYGGAFKVARGLSTDYGDRVLSTPISEAAIVGLSIGLALGGKRPVVEIMFGDFVTLAMDQLVNQAAKVHFTYGGRLSLPLTVRLVSGGYRGYGPTHSQSLEGLLCGVPGLKVVALSRRHDPVRLLRTCVLRDQNPVILVENKTLYSLRPHPEAPPGFRFFESSPECNGHYPPLAYTTTDEDTAADCTVVTYGGLTDLVEEAMEQLVLEEELDFDYFVLTQLSPPYLRDVVESVHRTRRLLTVEEGPKHFGVGAEILAVMAAEFGAETFRATRVGAEPVPIPNSRHQEREVLPSKDRIVEAAVGLLP